MDDGFEKGGIVPGEGAFSMLRTAATERVRQALGADGLAAAGAHQIAELANDVLDELVSKRADKPGSMEQRQLLREVVEVLNAERAAAAKGNEPAPEPTEDPLADPLSDAGTRGPGAPEAKNKRAIQVKQQVMPLLMQRIDISVASSLGPEQLRAQIAEIVEEIIVDLRIQLNAAELRNIVRLLVDDMVGLGPLEPLLHDETVTDIMVNGPYQVYVERKGKVELTDVVFRDDPHVLHVATRIVTEVGRRVDESTPLVDARLKDGSRVNIIIPPLAIDGPTISIRKFSKKEITLDVMARQNNISAEMATVLKIAGRARLNILISGGTGSGKTTLLNAMSRMIDMGERTVTIEDAAELQLQQPHVVRLETRPANIEGEGEITMRHLVKNALRMRPDRIILGEIRGEEAIDMLQAMNTGHDGSMGTIHSNTPRDALTRLENMVAMSGFKLPAEAVREQIQSAVHLIVQISRMRDGKRRITQVTEITGMEGEIVTTQDLFKFIYDGEKPDGSLSGRFECSHLRPHFMPRAEYFGLGNRLLEAMGCRST
jgi:pilus assembly protein CpaF